ncbi:MAG: peroxiredoxin [Sulfobacillus acidophilus]|uniref:thioredoxin-dependent peroxiredoxin n=1 Tax=Sulfobacillus acidophilus TaxID=53633 RepID=A0A2T2WII0_9FIRM|nr:MAG: peroxiredoxin [Sulfobacillus acidophilus]
MNIKEGDQFPQIAGQTHDGQTIRLADYQGKKNVVLYFYPKDLTPGCTREAIDFDRKLADFEAKDTVVIGMSVDPAASHATFSQACGLHFPLLSDADQSVSQKLGILTEIPGHPELGQVAQRTTFIIDTKGQVRRIFSVSQVDGHVDEVLRTVSAIN